MKTHHAAALVLLDWILLVPFVGHSTAPLSQWPSLGSNKTESGCETGRQALVKRFGPGGNKILRRNTFCAVIHPIPGYGPDLAAQMCRDDRQLDIMASRCVPLDDPRIKGRSPSF
jgi:hypothetical protein